MYIFAYRLFREAFTSLVRAHLQYPFTTFYPLGHTEFNKVFRLTQSADIHSCCYFQQHYLIFISWFMKKSGSPSYMSLRLLSTYGATICSVKQTITVIQNIKDNPCTNLMHICISYVCCMIEKQSCSALHKRFPLQFLMCADIPWGSVTCQLSVGAELHYEACMTFMLRRLFSIVKS